MAITIKVFHARLLVLCLLASTAQLADSTVFVIVRRGGTVWIGASSNVSKELPNGSFVKVGEDCKIHRKGDLVMLHAGPTALLSKSDSGQFNFVKLILNAENPSLTLEDNQASITAAIERSYEDYGQGYAAWLQSKGKTLPERWITPLNAQTIVLLKLGTNKKAEARGFVIAMGMEKDHPHFFLTDIKFPIDGDFSLVYDGKKFPVDAEKWMRSAVQPLAWIKQTIRDKAAQDEADWGGPIQTAKIGANQSFQWLEKTSNCQ